MPRGLPRVANDQYQRVLDALDAAWGRRRQSSCSVGCAACCVGPFDVGPADLWLAAEALEQLPEHDRVSVMKRLAASSAAERRVFGGTPTVDSDESGFDAMCEELSETPCAFLSEQNHCLIYQRRPQPCRLMGAAWGLGVAQFELECPIDLTGEDARVVFDLDTHEDAIARIESRLPALPTGASRTTLVSGLDALLRG